MNIFLFAFNAVCAALNAVAYAHSGNGLNLFVAICCGATAALMLALVVIES